MRKVPFLTLEKAQEIAAKVPTPFHIYDEAGIRSTARALSQAFAWNPGFREYFAVKATPNPYILQILHEEGCGCDCATYSELLLSEAAGITGREVMFSSNVTPEQDLRKAWQMGAYINLDDVTHVDFLERVCGVPDTVCCRYNPGGSFSLGNTIMDMPRELLIYFVKESVARSRYRFERDFLLKQFNDKNLTVGVYSFEGVAMFNESTLEYYRNNLALTDYDTRHNLFRTDRNIYTKVRDRVPTTYGENAQIGDCIVADGCQLDGEAEHSVFFRQVRLGEGAQVKNCVIMNDCSIGAGAELYCAILDKDVVVRPGVRLIGTPENPMIVKRGEIV